MLEVSLDTSDKGRGMNSTVSEKPTRALLDERAGGESVGPDTSPSSCRAVADPTFDCLSSRPRKFGCWVSFADGVVGALPPIGTVFGVGGLMIMEMS